MGFETVTGQMETVQLNKLEVGEKIVGYLKDVVTEPNQFNGTSYNLLMVNPQTKREFKALTGGAAKYVAQNIAAFLGKAPMNEQMKENVERDSQLLGYLIEIERVGSYLNKKKQTVNTFLFRRDKDKPLTDEIAFAAAEKAATEKANLDSIPL